MFLLENGKLNFTKKHTKKFNSEIELKLRCIAFYCSISVEIEFFKHIAFWVPWDCFFFFFFLKPNTKFPNGIYFEWVFLVLKNTSTEMRSEGTIKTVEKCQKKVKTGVLVCKCVLVMVWMYICSHSLEFFRFEVWVLCLHTKLQ